MADEVAVSLGLGVAEGSAMRVADEEDDGVGRVGLKDGFARLTAPTLGRKSSSKGVTDSAADPSV
ncbi:hypothetical protein [Paenarthrobacter sp. NPDC089316]|uniref:hypothetical protein n=1 Tax=unclassified Paenarthrobacter TaxID=2634190 RepID=UPI003412B209